MSVLAARWLRWRRSPLFWILCAAAALRLAGMFWGLPGADGWDDDGVAPRNFLAGLAKTYAGGSYFTYPPLHMIVLAVLTAPGWIAALVNAHSLHPHDVIAEIIRVPYMTFFSLVARIVGAAMSLGTIALAGRMAEMVGGRRAGVFAAAACALNALLLYYGQVSNLDGPSLFWSALSLWGWMRVIAEHELRHIRWAALAAAAAVATKDQAYAVFVLSVPAAFLVWFALDEWPRRNARRIAGTLALWAALAVVALLAVDGALVNPTGFEARLAFLAGPASADYAQYQDDWSGRLQLLKDMWAAFPRSYPYAASVLILFGMAVVVGRTRRQRPLLVAGLLPCLAAVSFTVLFNFVALRSENRFLLPQTVLLAVYAGVAVAELDAAAQPLVRHAARGLAAIVAALALYQCIGLDAAFLRDPRYDAESWLRSHVRAGDAIEAYGLNVYLPRFPPQAIVTRLERKPLAARNPLPDVAEIDQPFGAVVSRRPRFVVVSAFWVADYLAAREVAPGKGRAVQMVKQANFADAEARAYFRALFGNRLPYRLARCSAYVSGFWPRPVGYESLTQTIFVFELEPQHAV